MNTSVAEANATASWGRRARYFNSGNAFAQTPSPVPSVQFLDERDRAFAADTPTGLIDMDLRGPLELPFAATTPLVMSRYMRVRAGETLRTAARASAQLFCILRGRGTTSVGAERAAWKTGDILALPGAAVATHAASEDAVVWYVTDEPTLSLLDLDPIALARSAVQPAHYLAEDLADQLEAVHQHPDADQFPGYAVVLSQQGVEHTRNIHSTMTLALNSLPPGRAQRPHVHNSMALTLCLQGDRCYSMIDGERKDWGQHAVMVTPPAAVHSHHNDGDRRMTCLIVQDGGLYYHARTMGFAFAD